MTGYPDLSVVIPLYNEAKHIESLITSWYDLFHRMHISFAVVLINDGSSDNSLAILQSLQKTMPELLIITHRNMGHGPSIFKGYQKGLQSTWVFQIDGDNQFEKIAFQELWERRNEYDLLLAERKLKQASLLRKMVSSVSRLSVRFFFGNGIRDVNSPYRLMRAKTLEEALNKIHPKDFAPNVLITSYFIFAKKRIFRNKVSLNNGSVKNVSRMSMYILKGSIQSVFSVIKFRLSL